MLRAFAMACAFVDHCLLPVVVASRLLHCCILSILVHDLYIPEAQIPGQGGGSRLQTIPTRPMGCRIFAARKMSGSGHVTVNSQGGLIVTAVTLCSSETGGILASIVVTAAGGELVDQPRGKRRMVPQGAATKAVHHPNSALLGTDCKSRQKDLTGKAVVLDGSLLKRRYTMPFC